jgi:hypothetical protein
VKIGNEAAQFFFWEEINEFFHCSVRLIIPKISWNILTFQNLQKVSLFKVRWIEEVSLFDRVASPGQLHFQLFPAHNRNFNQITKLQN